MYLAYALTVTLPIPRQYLLPVSFTKILPCQDSPVYGTCTCTQILLKVLAFYLSTSPKTMSCTCTCTSTNVKVLVLYLSTFTCTSPHACMRLPIITFVSHWLRSQLLGKIRMYIHKYIHTLYTHVVHSYLLVKFFNMLLDHIWPKVTLKVCQLCDAGQVIINRLSVHILNIKNRH